MFGLSVFDITGSIRDWQVLDRLPEITVPTLVLAGRYDECVPEHMAEMHRRIPGSRFELFESSSHTPFIEEPEAFDRVMEKRIEGFGELFRMLSYQKIGTSTMQSRAIGGVAGGTYLFALPGSTGAVKDGWDDILVSQLDNRHRPCNLVELMPRLQEHLQG